MKAWRTLLSIILFFTLPIFAAPGSTKQIGNGKVIKVAALLGPPFVARGFDGKLRGLAIDIFKQVAIKNNWQYQFILVDGSVESLLNDLKNKKYDIVIGPISINFERMKIVDFSRPYYLSEEKLAIHRHTASPLKAVIDIIYSIPLGIFIYILVLLLVIAHIIWLSERHKNPEMPQKYLPGIIFSTWFFIAHFFKGGLLYRPKTNTARAILLIWLILALSIFLIATSTYTAYITARLVDSKQSIEDVAELVGVKIAYVQGHSYASFPKEVGAIGVPVATVEEALKMIKDRKVFGAIGDQIILASALNKSPNKDVVISTMRLRNDEFAFAFPENSPYLRPVNLAIVEMQDNGDMHSICETHVGNFNLNCEF